MFRSFIDLLCLLMGPPLAGGPREHPWLMSVLFFAQLFSTFVDVLKSSVRFESLRDDFSCHFMNGKFIYVLSNEFEVSDDLKESLGDFSWS